MKQCFGMYDEPQIRWGWCQKNCDKQIHCAMKAFNCTPDFTYLENGRFVVVDTNGYDYPYEQDSDGYWRYTGTTVAGG